jgi:peptidyl-prolyl cis-trans isomerase NIMA-interacting 4
MAPKNKNSGGKDSKSKDKSESSGKGGDKGKLKPANSINVRHILCEKHSKKEEALTKLREGKKFDEVAREMSEDKARQGAYTLFVDCPVPGKVLVVDRMNWDRSAEGLLRLKMSADDCAGGSLGWKTRGSLIKEFEDVAYGLEVSTTSSPKWGEVKTKEGYHIMMVEGRK